MKRFKLIFHTMYILVTLLVMYFSVDILLNTEAYLSKIKLSSYITFPKKVMGVFLFISVLMSIEYVMQQLRIRSIKNGIEDMEAEITELKAKLYDKSQEPSDLSFDDVDKGDEDADEDED